MLSSKNASPFRIGAGRGGAGQAVCVCVCGGGRGVGCRVAKIVFLVK